MLYKELQPKRTRAYKMSQLEAFEKAAEEYGYGPDEDMSLGTIAQILRVSIDSLRRWEKMNMCTYRRNDRGNRILTLREGYAIYFRCFFKKVKDVAPSH